MKLLIILLVAGAYYAVYQFFRWLNSEKVQNKLLDILFPKQARANWATHTWCDASQARREWENLHPYDNQSHPEAQRLLQIEIGAYMLWLDAHPKCRSESNIGYLQFLLAQMEDWVT